MRIGRADPTIQVVDLELRASFAADLPSLVDRLPLGVEVSTAAISGATADILTTIRIGNDMMGTGPFALRHIGLLYRVCANQGSLSRPSAQDRDCTYGVSKTRCIVKANFDTWRKTSASTLGQAITATETRLNSGGACGASGLQQELPVGDRKQGRRPPLDRRAGAHRRLPEVDRLHGQACGYDHRARRLCEVGTCEKICPQERDLRSVGDANH